MPRPSRILVVDMLRVVAAVQMVQGHTIDAVLDSSVRRGFLFEGWLRLRGLTAVAFLFSAGMAFQLSTLRDLDAHLRRPDLVARRFARAGRLVALGYLLHLPWVALLPGPAAAREAAWVAAVAVDVLQCIGVSLAVIEALALVLRDARRTELACAVLGAVALGLAPLASGLDASGPWRPLLDYCTPSGGSLFPLVPWAGHMLLGVGLCRPLVGEGARLRPLLGGALGLLALYVALCVSQVPYVLRDHVGRLLGVLIALAALAPLQDAVRHFPLIVYRLSSQTLVIYVSHVVLVYGSGLGLAALVGPRLSPTASAAVAAAMIALSFGCALLYGRASTGLAGRTATG